MEDDAEAEARRGDRDFNGMVITPVVTVDGREWLRVARLPVARE